MAHEIDTMMFAKDVPWHGLGKYVGDKAVTSEEAIKAAKLNWKVGLQPVLAQIGNRVSLADEYRAVVREDNQNVLGVVGTRYAPIQNESAFQFMDSLVRGKFAMYHTAGSLCGGKKIWMLCELPGDVKVKGKDVVKKYLLLVNYHNGDGAARCFFTPVRVVCANTLNAALRQAKSEGYSIRHTGDIDQKVKAAQKILGLAQEYYREFQVKANFLADTKFNDTMMSIALSKVFPADNENEVPTRTKNIRDSVTDLFQGFGKGSKDFRGTAWGAYNAFTEYADHIKSIRGEKDKDGEVIDSGARLDSLWFGSSAQLKTRSLEVIDAIIQVAA